jgi:hypothetical protein
LTRLILLALGLLCLGSTHAAEPRLGFKGLQLGDAYQDDPRFSCHALRGPLGDSVCTLRSHERETIANVPLHSLFRYYGNGRLTGLVLHIDAKDFTSVQAALAQRYGNAPARRETVRNYQGKTFENETYHWQRPDGSLTLIRSAGRIDQSAIRFIDDAALRGLSQKRSKPAAQDL